MLVLNAKIIFTWVAFEDVFFSIVYSDHVYFIIGPYFLVCIRMVRIEDTVASKVFDVFLCHINTACCQIEKEITPVLIVLSNVDFDYKILIFDITDIKHKRLFLGQSLNDMNVRDNTYTQPYLKAVNKRSLIFN